MDRQEKSGLTGVLAALILVLSLLGIVYGSFAFAIGREIGLHLAGLSLVAAAVMLR